MIFDFNPWQIDVDIELTKQLYKEVDYSIDKTTNVEFIESLSSEQKQFFYSLGVDLAKVEIDKTIYEIPEDEEMPASKINRMLVNFLIKGKILALPKYQKNIYSDEEVFGKKFPESIKVLIMGLGQALYLNILVSIMMMKNSKIGIADIF